MKKAYFILLSITLVISEIFFLGCAGSSRKVELSSPLVSPIHRCFSFIIAGKNQDFFDLKEECIKYENQEGMTSLMMAIYKNNSVIFDYLLSTGVDILQKDKSGFDALFYSVNSGRTDMVKKLRRLNAPVMMNSTGSNQLWIAIQGKSFDLIKGIDPTINEIDLRGEDGWSAIYFAIRRQDVLIFDFILKPGVCLNLRDTEQATPLDFAREVSWKYAIERLQKAKSSACK